MRVLRRYYFKEFFKFFFIVIFSLTAILMIAEFFDKADEFYAKEGSSKLILQYLFLHAPKFMLYASPMASLFSILITIGIASSLRETTAIKAGGGSLKGLFSSFLVLGAFLSLFTFIIGETVVPAATRQASYVRSVKILKRPSRITFKEQALWLKGLDGSLIRIKDFIEEKDQILEMSIFKFDPSFGLEKRIESGGAQWSDGSWKLKDSTVFDLNTRTTEKHDSLVSHAMDEPKIFKEEMKKPDEMNFIELRDYYTRLEKAGFKNLKYTVRLYEKLAYPTINFVMIVFGIALGLNTTWGGGLRAAGLGVLVTVLYWLVYSVSISLGNTGAVLPWLAPWIGPVVFGLAGSGMYWHIKE